MSSIDERVVEMSFRRDDFLKGTEETLGALDRLDGALSGGGGIASNVEKIGSRFNALGALAFTALQRIGNAAIDAGMNIVSFVTDPLFAGGEKRALNIEQARFQFKGLGMDVEAAMDSALTAVKGTAFGLDEAAVVAAQFGASGMEAGEDMTNALRGIAGVAAMAGSSYGDVGNVFTKVAGQGRLMGDDLNRLASRGVNAAATLVKYFKKTGKGANLTEADIRKMVTKGEIDFQTFSDAMADAFGEHATKANDTYAGSLANLRAAISRIGASFAAANFEKMRVIFNALTPVIDDIANALSPLIEGFVRLAGIEGSDIAGWLTNLHDTFPWALLENAIGAAVRVVFAARAVFLSILEPVSAAYEAIFGPSDGGASWLVRLTSVLQGLATWIYSFKLTEDQAASLQARIVSFVQAVQDGFSRYVMPAGRIIMELGRVLWDFGVILFSLIAPIRTFLESFSIPGSGNKISEWLTAIADALARFRETGLKDFGKAMLELFSGAPAAAIKVFRDALEYVLGLVSRAGEAIGELFPQVQSAGTGFGSWISGFFGGIMSFLGQVFSFIAPIGVALRDVLAGALTGLGNSLKTMSPLDIFSWLSAALNLGVVMSIKGIIDSVLGIVKGAEGMFSGIGGSLTAISEALSGFTDVLSAMQNNLNASALLKIAGAIGILALAILIMSRIDPNELVGAVFALSIIATIMIGAIKVISQIAEAEGFQPTKMVAITVALGLLSLALLGFVAAIAILAYIPMDNMAQGLAGLAIALGLMVGAAALLSLIGPRMIGAAFGLNLMATAIGLLVIPIIALGFIPMDVLMQGLMGVGIALGGLVVAALLLSLVGPKLLIVAPALMLMALALNMLVIPILALGLMDHDSMMQGLVGVSIALGVLVLAAMALSLVAPQLLIVAPALAIMAFALNLMVVPIIAMAALPFDAMLQGISGIALALSVLVLAAAMMGGAILGAVGIALMSAALIGLAVAITILAAIPIEGLVSALTGMAMALGILIGAAALSMAVLPGMLALAGLMLVFAVAAIAIGAATILFAAGAVILGAALPALVAGLVEFTKWSPLIALATPLFALIAVAMLAFGAAALLAAPGVIALGAGLLLLGLALPVIIAAGAAGAAALLSFAEALMPLLFKIPQLGAIAVTLAALGAAMVVLGAGLLLAGAGGIVFGAGAIVAGLGLAIFMGLAQLVAPLAENLAISFGKLAIVGGKLLVFAEAAMAVAGGLRAFAASTQLAHMAVVLLSNGLVMTANAFAATASAAMSASSVTASAMNLLSVTISAGAVRVLAAAELIIRAFMQLAAGIMSSGPMAANATSSVINAIVITMTGGAVIIARAVVLIVKQFTLLSVQILATGVLSVTGTRSLIQGIVRELSSGVGPIGSSITEIITAFGRLSAGILQNGSKTSGAVNSLVTGMVSALRNSQGSARTAAYNVGVAVGDGMVSGLASQSARVSSQARGMATAAVNAAKNALEIKSPSRKFRELANFAVDGFILPFRDRVSEAEKSSANLGNSLYGAMNAVIEEMESEFTDIDTWGFSPVITPVLDLDQAQRQAMGFKGFGSMDADLGYSQASALATLDDALRKSAEDRPSEEPKEINFIQHNTSPKALSEAEIYRRSKNLISEIVRKEP